MLMVLMGIGQPRRKTANEKDYEQTQRSLEGGGETGVGSVELGVEWIRLMKRWNRRALGGRGFSPFQSNHYKL